MGTEKTKHNYTFYQGYEGEPEIILTLLNIETIHIWDGYFEDIYGNPPLDGKGWTGFTRDYNQIIGAFSDLGEVEIDPAEYLADLIQYKDKAYQYEETKQVFALMIDFFTKATERKLVVTAKLE